MENILNYLTVHTCNDHIFDDQSEYRIHEVVIITGNFSGTGCSCYISAPDGDCCDSSGISSCTYAGSVDRNICCIGNDFPDHVYFLYQTGTKDGVCCTSYTDCICSENTISGTCCVCTDIYTGKSGADELRNSCVLYGGIS